MISNDFISSNHIIAEVAVAVDDTSFRKGFSKGWFNSRIQDAMQELAIDTFFQTIQKDVEIPDILQVKIPENVFNIREIYAYNGSLCNPNGGTQNVYYKRLFNNNYNGDGYTSKVKDDGDSNSGDLFVPNRTSGRIYGAENYPYSGRKFYANNQNGILMLSQDCASYSYLRIIYNGMGTPIGDIPIIPRFFEEAVKGWVCLAYFKAMKSRNSRKYRTLWIDAKNDLEGANGTWSKAKNRIKRMNTYEKSSYEEYFSNMYAK